MLRKNDEACLSSISRSMEGRCRVHRRPMMRPEGIIPSGPTYIPTTPCLSTTHRREKICELRTKSCNTRAALFSANRIARVFTYELVRLRGNISYHIMYRKYPRGGNVYLAASIEGYQSMPSRRSQRCTDARLEQELLADEFPMNPSREAVTGVQH